MNLNILSFFRKKSEDYPDDDKVVRLHDYVAGRPMPKGERICCPKCDSHEYWKVYSKKHIDGKLYITGIVCTSDECDGVTLIEITGGAIK